MTVFIAKNSVEYVFFFKSSLRLIIEHAEESGSVHKRMQVA